MQMKFGSHSRELRRAHSQTPPSQIVVPRPDIEAVVQAMSTKTCAGIVTGKEAISGRN
jgi:hypothetical protein